MWTTHQRVVELDLHSYKLVGAYLSIGNLSFLRLLNLENNSLSSSILENWVKFVGGNHLKGVIPHSIGRLKRLEIFSFGANNLSGTIPPSIFNLSTLTGFAVPVNQLHGTLPPDLGHTLPNLEILLVHTNRFSGLIPMTISNASNLSVLTQTTSSLGKYLA
uniref:Leucine-rich repeat-containing N-terminal plant-type domain-containing protein n=1 Tax=Salix viminalis TaxID=40686 RepID=A0A6N2KXT1_SALVM